MLDFPSAARPRALLPVSRRLLGLAAAAGLGTALAAGCEDSPPVTADEATCSELGGQARSEGLDVLAAGDRSCSEDSQCVVSNQHPRCTDPCGYQAAINISAVVDVQAEMLDIESDYCDDFERKSCSVIALPCAPMATMQPVCRDGQCELVPE